VFGSDRGESVTAMADAFANWLRRQGNVAGIISAGGSGGASLVAPGMRANWRFTGNNSQDFLAA